MLRLIIALLVSLIGMLLIGPRVLPVLRRLKFGQTIYELGPKAHQVKQGTPTMGGLMFALTTIVAALLLHGTWYGWNDFSLALIAVSLLTMLVGFVDDYIKVVKKRNLGLVWWQKVVAQVVISAAFAWYCYQHPLVGSKIIIPFFNVEWDLGIFYVPLITLTVLFMTNSANLQDGLDGLLGTVTVTGMAGYGVIALLFALSAGTAGMNNYFVAGILAFALAGAKAGYLRYNHYPAQIFMGDTGSMFVGGAMVGIAVVLRIEFLLLLISFTCVMSSVSVIMQRVYFKLTHGKRIFKMSPIHHHFELCGMKETQIVLMYGAVTILLSVIAVLSVMHWF